MDLRGIAKISNNEYIIAGGMLKDTIVSNKTFLLTYDTNYVDVKGGIKSDFYAIKVFPNPVNDVLNIDINKFESATIFTILGEEIINSKSHQIYVKDLPKGIYILKIVLKGKSYSKIVNKI